MEAGGDDHRRQIAADYAGAQACLPGCTAGDTWQGGAPPLMRTGAPGYDNAAWLCARTALLCVLNGLFFRASFFSKKKNGLKFENLAQKKRNLT